MRDVHFVQIFAGWYSAATAVEMCPGMATKTWAIDLGAFAHRLLY
jgi:hypothetical protein